VLDLGCGFGWFCRFARQQGAASVLGVDVSERMLARAKAETSDPAISYQRADLERLTLASDSFDVAYSSLALHYIANLEALLALSSSRPSTRSTRRRPIPAGWMPMAARPGRSTAISTRAHARPTGSPRA
jgi:SAM-dependent methyltransferase